MNKIATHDSATGEKSWWLSYLWIPFSKTQSKTIQEQIKLGCRYFDIRVRKTCRGWICAHGLWESKKTVDEILEEINQVESYCNITYEGFGNKSFLTKVDEWSKKYKNIRFVYINIKYGKKLKWENIKIMNIVECGSKDAFFKLNFTSWHTFLPIPWLWKKIYGPNPTFNNLYYQFVDFL